MAISARRAAPRVAVCIAGFAAVAASQGLFDSGADIPSLPAGVVEVVRVVDGDTIVVDLAGTEESVRLLGIDTPETVDPRSPVDCYGPEASARAKALVPEGTRVRLVRDVEARDRYDRLLAYVYRADDATFINLALVEEGFATALAYEPNTTHSAELSRAESAARSAGRGLWSACGGPSP